MSDVETAVDGAQVAPVENAAEGQQTQEHASESTTEQVDTTEQGNKPRDEKGRFVPQERVNEITRARREAERRAEALERELAAYRQQQPAHQPQSNDKPPSIGDFGDVDQWAAAMTQYAVTQAERNVSQRFQQNDAQRHQQQIVQQFDERALKYAADHPDFDQSVAELGQTVQFRPEVVEVIGLSDHGPAVAHYLAKHLDEADRISRLPLHLAAAHLGRIEAQVSAPKPAKPVTSAPNPAPTLAGGGKPALAIREGMTYAEYKAARMKGGG